MRTTIPHLWFNRLNNVTFHKFETTTMSQYAVSLFGATKFHWLFNFVLNVTFLCDNQKESLLPNICDSLRIVWQKVYATRMYQVKWRPKLTHSNNTWTASAINFEQRKIIHLTRAKTRDNCLSPRLQSGKNALIWSISIQLYWQRQAATRRVLFSLWQLEHSVIVANANESNELKQIIIKAELNILIC